MDERYLQAPQPIRDTSAEVDGTGLFKILGGAGNFCHLETFVEYLRYHLVIKNKIIAVLLEGNRGEHILIKSPITGMVFRKLLA